MIDIGTQVGSRIRQGDIYRDIEFVESASEQDGEIEISVIRFPLCIVLSQDCDLEGENSRRVENKTNADNKFLLSTVLAPLYNFDHFRIGEHLSNLQLRLEDFGPRKKSKCNFIVTNQNPRYHYLSIPPGHRIVQELVVDFKHYFTVPFDYLESRRGSNFVVAVKELYREDIVQRFASFLSRIGLPS